MISINYKRIYFIILGLIILLFDQTTKYLIINNYDHFINKNFILFSLELIKNYGAAFNILSGNRIFLSIISIFISLILFLLIIRKKITNNIDLYSYSFILGGSLGNGIDRIINGYVIDFISINYINFPIFNVADVSINIGFFILLYSIVKNKK